MVSELEQAVIAVSGIMIAISVLVLYISFRKIEGNKR